MDASSSTSPSTFGFPPRPTLVSVVSASMTFEHASTASRAEPPRGSTRPRQPRTRPRGHGPPRAVSRPSRSADRGVSRRRTSRTHRRKPAFARWQKHLHARFAEDHPAAHPPPARRRPPARPSRLTLLTRAGEYALGGVRAREMHFTPGTDGEGALPCELIAMNNIGYAAVWSAKLISVPQMQVAAIEPVNIVMRVVYNTLDGIINDYFVITASVAKR